MALDWFECHRFLIFYKGRVTPPIPKEPYSPADISFEEISMINKNLIREGHKPIFLLNCTKHLVTLWDQRHVRISTFKTHQWLRFHLMLLLWASCLTFLAQFESLQSKITRIYPQQHMYHLSIGILILRVGRGQVGIVVVGIVRKTIWSHLWYQWVINHIREGLEINDILWFVCWRCNLNFGVAHNW